LLPHRDSVPADIDSDISSEMSYYARQVPVSLLLDEEFIQGFVKAGNVSHVTTIS